MRVTVVALVGAMCPIVAGCESPSYYPYQSSSQSSSRYTSPYSPQPTSAGARASPAGRYPGAAPAAPTASNSAPVTNPLPVSTTPPPVRRFSGIPMPANNSIDLDHTIVLGSESEWLGRVLFTTPMTVDEVVDFYRREMPRYGWAEFAATRSTTTILAYQAGARAATIQVTAESQNQSPSGTRVEFWVIPHPAGAGTPVSQKTEPQKTEAQKTEAQKTEAQGAEPSGPVPLNGLRGRGGGGDATSGLVPPPPPRPPVDETRLPP